MAVLKAVLNCSPGSLAHALVQQPLALPLQCRDIGADFLQAPPSPTDGDIVSPQDQDVSVVLRTDKLSASVTHSLSGRRIQAISATSDVVILVEPAYIIGMSPEILTMSGTGIALASLIITGQQGLDKRIDSLARDVAEVRERLARLEGLFRGLFQPRPVLPPLPEDYYKQAT